MNWKHWLRGLAAAAVTGSSTAVLSTIGTNATGDPLNWHQILTITGFSGVVSAAAYLKQSPLPAETETKTTTVTVEQKKETTRDGE